MPIFMGSVAKRIAVNGAYAERVYVGPYLAWQSTLRQERLTAGDYLVTGHDLTARRTRIVFESGSFVMSGGALLTQTHLVFGAGNFAIAGNELNPDTPFDESNIARTNVENVFSAVQTIEYSNVAKVGLTLHLNDDGASSGPIVELIRHSTTPATNDFLANIRFIGYSSSAAKVTGVTVVGFVTSAAAATYSARLEIWTTQVAVSALRMFIGAGLVVGAPTGSDKGVGTVNAVELYRNGTLIRDIAETLTNKTIAAPIITGLMDLQGGQIKFPSTQSPSSDPNTLDDYEEGLWTPVFTFATPGDLNVASYSTQEGSYTKVGNIVLAKFRVIIAAGQMTYTTAASFMQLTGLPFTSESGSPSYGNIVFAGITKAGYTQFVPQVGLSATVISFQGSGSGVATAVISAPDVPSGGLIRLNGFLAYIAA